MLVLTRDVGEKIDIIAVDPQRGDHIIVQYVEPRQGYKVRIGTEASLRYEIYRSEVTKSKGGQGYIDGFKHTFFDAGGGI